MGTISVDALSTQIETQSVHPPPDITPWYKQRHLLKLNLTIISLVLYSSSNGYDGSLMNGLQALDQWKAFMNNPTGSWLGLINAVYWLGCGVGFPVTSWIANKYGRKLGVYIGYLFLALGCALQTAAGNATAFILARMFLGLAAALFSNTALLVNEIAHPAHRGLLNCLFMSGWYIGGTVAAWVVFATRDYSSSWAWRLPSILQALVPVIGLPGLLLAPESPRWLISVGREDEAHQILVNYHAGGDADSPFANSEFEDIVSALSAEREAHRNGSYIKMVKTPGNRHRLLISVTLGLFSQWVGNGVISYYLSLVLDAVGVTKVRDQTLISACLQIWNLCFAVLGSYLIDRLGRRPLFMASAAIMFVSYVLVTALSGSFANTHDSNIGAVTIPFLYTFFAGYCIALTPLLTSYPCEIWPFQMRSRGLVVMWVSTICAIFFNTFVNPIALAALGWKYFFVFVAVLLAFGFTSYFVYPETKGYPLEAIAVLFDGPDFLIAEDSRIEGSDFSDSADAKHKDSI
ncbi:hypothetical protein N7495_001641 [Penicillium taxi]|uniref:uncharacterized protein n=1 Tax=Penicillium taxi TaxID=168475 RepID=UPI0025455A02|nr:uncharacterized protein N7495_001641 [Penicillium taxi]KAJ5908959.1 hypothetical protein N7495_001641 [Penicillium taxi]